MKFFSSLLVIAALHHQGKHKLGTARKKLPGNTEDTNHRSRLSTFRTPPTTIFVHALFCDVVHASHFHSRTYQIQDLSHHCLSRVVSMHRLIFLHKILLKIRSRIPVSTHTPATSAVMAVPILNGTPILLIVTHLSLSAPLITTLRRLLPLFLALPSQNPFSALHLSVLPLLSTIIFLCLT